MVRLIVSLLCSAGTLAGMWLAGNHKRLGWAISFFTEAVWLLFIVVFAAWGLLPLVVACSFVYARNWLRWSK